MNTMNTSNNTTTDLEAPLLNRKPVEIHSAIPITITDFDDDEHDKDSDDDYDYDQTNVLDGSCNLANVTYAFGLFVGVIVQVCLLYAIGVVLPDATGTGPNVLLVFALYFFSRYWILVALLLPPVVTTMFLKLRAYQAKKSKLTNATVRDNMESFFECLRFQLGMFFGSLISLSCINFYTLSKTAPLCVLLAYYTVSIVVSFFALCLLQIFINQLCKHIASVEIIVCYEKDEEDME